MEIEKALWTVAKFSNDLTAFFDEEFSNNEKLYEDLKGISNFKQRHFEVRQAVKTINDEYNKLLNNPPIKEIYLIPYKPLFGQTKYLQTDYELTITDKTCSYCGAKFLLQNPILNIPNEYFCPHCQRILHID